MLVPFVITLINNVGTRFNNKCRITIKWGIYYKVHVLAVWKRPETEIARGLGFKEEANIIHS